MLQDLPRISHINQMDSHIIRGLGSKLSIQGNTLGNQITLKNSLPYPNTETAKQTFFLSTLHFNCGLHFTMVVQANVTFKCRELQKKDRRE